MDRRKEKRGMRKQKILRIPGENEERFKEKRLERRKEGERIVCPLPL
jgi:hypothetical protein